MSGPPGKETGAVLHAPKAEPTKAYHVSLVVQAQWQREADRLLGEYQRTRSARDWRAYITHLAGMVSRLEGSETA